MGCAAPTPRGRPWLEETCFENCPGASCTTSLGQSLRENVVNACPAPGRDNNKLTFSMFLLAVFLHGRGGVRRGEAGLPNYKLTSPPLTPRLLHVASAGAFPCLPDLRGATEPRIGPMEPL